MALLCQQKERKRGEKGAGALGSFPSSDKLLFPSLTLPLMTPHPQPAGLPCSSSLCLTMYFLLVLPARPSSCSDSSCAYIDGVHLPAKNLEHSRLLPEMKCWRAHSGTGLAHRACVGRCLHLLVRH